MKKTGKNLVAKKNKINNEATAWKEDIVVEELNKIHAVVRVGQTYILTEKKDYFGNKDFDLESRQSFISFYEDEIVQCHDNTWQNKANIWIKHPNRRKYKGIIFDPTTSKSKNDYYNLWKGFSRQSQQGDCSKYWQHVQENICNNNEELYRYVRKWIACVFQHPDEVHTALVLCGSQGVGKNSFVEPLGVLLGPHYAPLSSINELVSNFNYHLKNAVLIHANEALWGDNKKDIGTIKAMITERTCLIEGKGKNGIIVPNFKHIIFSSNDDWPVHLDPDDRRFAVTHVSEARKENHAYFKAIQDELDSGGYEALLYDLLHEDLTEFNPRILPSSNDSFTIKLRSAESAHRYLYEALDEGGFFIGDIATGNYTWQLQIPKDAVYQDYMSWCKKNSEEILSKQLFGKTIKKILPLTKDTRISNGDRIRCYKFLTLTKTREDFAKSFKVTVDNVF